MIDTSAIARPYGLAAYEQAQAEGALAQWSSALEFLAAVVSDRTMANAIADPRLDNSALTELLLDVCDGRLSKTQENFGRILIENDRLLLAGSIAEIFERERAKLEGRASVLVTSAFALNKKQQGLISDMMSKRLAREVDIECSVDKALIGGVIIRTGDVVIDASLRGRLRQLEGQFA